MRVDIDKLEALEKDVTLTAETWAMLRAAWPAYEDDQMAVVINLPRFQRNRLMQLSHALNPDPECDHCQENQYAWASEGSGAFTAEQVEYWRTSEVLTGFDRRWLATIDALLREVRELRGIAEAARKVDFNAHVWAISQLRDALALYDAGGTARALSGEQEAGQ
jgi:hypothetical protein